MGSSENPTVTPQKTTALPSTQAPGSLAMVSSNRGHLHLRWQLDVSSGLANPSLPSTNSCKERFISTKLGLWLLPSTLDGNKVWLICHCFGVWYFFIDLLRDIPLCATGLWNDGSSRGESALNKWLARRLPSVRTIWHKNKQAFGGDSSCSRWAGASREMKPHFCFGGTGQRRVQKESLMRMSVSLTGAGNGSGRFSEQ